MKARLVGCTFLVGCFTTLALGQDQNVEPRFKTRSPKPHQQIERPQEQSPARSGETWLAKQSKDLLDIIKILYKGREAELKELEAAQESMKSEDQIERRIALIKATLSEKEAK